VKTLVFQVGDKVPDGGRVAAIETQTGIRVRCRIPTTATKTLKSPSDVTWTNLESESQPSVTKLTELGWDEDQGFMGLDREVEFRTDGTDMDEYAGRRVEVVVKLPPQENVIKVSSDGVVKRSDGMYALGADKEGKMGWVKVVVLKRDATSAFITGVSKDAKLLRIDKEIQVIEKFLAKSSGAAERKG
jgi:hypothetical protein